jgi:hypothetical protein
MYVRMYVYYVCICSLSHSWYVYVCMHVCMYAYYVCTCTSILPFSDTYIYTHTHTQWTSVYMHLEATMAHSIKEAWRFLIHVWGDGIWRPLCEWGGLIWALLLSKHTAAVGKAYISTALIQKHSGAGLYGRCSYLTQYIGTALSKYMLVCFS